MLTQPYTVSEKLVISGQYLEFYDYEIPYWVGYPKLKPTKFRIVQRTPLKSQEEMRDDNVRRTRIKIRRLVNCNQDLVKFMTLTFADEVFDLNQSNPLFRAFIKRINRRYPDFKYLCVPEFQKNGRVHYHLLCNLPYIENIELTELWGHGFTFIRRINHIDNVGAYICKYLGKANFDTRYFKKNKFFYSYNLLRPLVVDKIGKIADFVLSLPFSDPTKCVQLKAFEVLTKIMGMLKYAQYRVVDKLRLEEAVRSLGT